MKFNYTIMFFFLQNLDFNNSSKINEITEKLQFNCNNTIKNITK